MKKPEPSHTAGRNVLWPAATVKAVWVFLHKSHRELPYDLPTLSLNIYLKELKTDVETKIHTQMFTAAQFLNSQKVETSQTSID